MLFWVSWTSVSLVVKKGFWKQSILTEHLEKFLYAELRFPYRGLVNH